MTRQQLRTRALPRNRFFISTRTNCARRSQKFSRFSEIDRSRFMHFQQKQDLLRTFADSLETQIKIIPGAWGGQESLLFSDAFSFELALEISEHASVISH